MQFVRQGPDIPERLLQAHEEGRVVFFCGAGISYPARLPSFAGLVEKLYVALATTPNAVQQAAINAGQFDTAVGLLEADIVGGRKEAIVRKALADILTPDLGAPNATATHEALLTLGRSREGRTRLITTNFDRLFEEVIAVKSLSVERFQAPLLPVPKNRWDGLVYLHGLLADTHLLPVSWIAWLYPVATSASPTLPSAGRRALSVSCFAPIPCVSSVTALTIPYCAT